MRAHRKAHEYKVSREVCILSYMQRSDMIKMFQDITNSTMCRTEGREVTGCRPHTQRCNACEGSTGSGAPPVHPPLVLTTCHLGKLLNFSLPQFPLL